MAIGSIIGAGLGLVSSLFGGSSASRAAREARRRFNDYLLQEEKDNQSWYDRRYNEDVTQRGDALRLLGMTQQHLRNRGIRDAGMQAVMGGTQESVAAAKEANSRLLSDVAGQIAAQGASQKDNVEAQYRNRKSAIRQARATGELNEGMQRAENIAKTTGAVGTTFANLGGAIDDYMDDYTGNGRKRRRGDAEEGQ